MAAALRLAALLLPALVGVGADQLGLVGLSTGTGLRKKSVILRKDGIRFGNGQLTQEFEMKRGHKVKGLWLTVHNDPREKALAIEFDGCEGSLPLSVADWFADNPSGKDRVQARRVELACKQGKKSDLVLFAVRVEDNHKETWATFFDSAKPILEKAQLESDASSEAIESDLKAAWQQAYHSHDENNHYVLLFGNRLDGKRHQIQVKFSQGEQLYQRTRELGGTSVDGRLEDATWWGTSIPMPDSSADIAFAIDVDGMEALPLTELSSSGPGAVRCKAFTANPGAQYSSWFVAAFDQKPKFDAFRKAVKAAAGAFDHDQREWDKEVLAGLCANAGAGGSMEAAADAEALQAVAWKPHRMLPHGPSTLYQGSNLLGTVLVLLVGVAVVAATVYAWRRWFDPSALRTSVEAHSSNRSYRSMAAPSICGGTWEAEQLSEHEEEMEEFNRDVHLGEDIKPTATSRSGRGESVGKIGTIPVMSGVSLASAAGAASSCLSP